MATSTEEPRARARAGRAVPAHRAGQIEPMRAEPAEGASAADPDRGVEPAPTVVPIPEGSYFAELPIESITPNPRQPRTVFDEDAMAELVDSIAEVGLLQPVVVRPLGGRPVRAGDGGAAVAGDPGGRSGRHPGHRPGDQGPRPPAGRAAGEPAPGAAQPARGGGGVPADARGLRLHAGRAGQPDQALPAADLQHASDCCGCRRRCSAGSPPACSVPVTPAPCWPSTTPPARSGWLSGWWPRGCRSGRSRRWSRSARPARTPRRPRRTRRQVPAPEADDVAARLSDHLDTRVRVELGRRRGRITIDFATAEDLERIARLIEQK